MAKSYTVLPHLFGDDMRKKNLFANEYEILYDTIRDHDTYGCLRISLEVDRVMTDRCVVVLNGRPIGIVISENVTRHDVSYTAFRFSENGTDTIQVMPDVFRKCTRVVRENRFRSLGEASAAVISDFA